MSLTDPQLRLLKWLHDNGGEAVVQGQFVVALATGARSSASATITFLHLIAADALFVENGRFYVSDYGERVLQRYARE